MHHITPFWDEKFIYFPGRAPPPRHVRRLDSRVFGARPATPQCSNGVDVHELQGDFAPWPHDQGLCPWTPLGAPRLRPQTPVISSRSALTMCPPHIFWPGDAPETTTSFMTYLCCLHLLKRKVEVISFDTLVSRYYSFCILVKSQTKILVSYLSLRLWSQRKIKRHVLLSSVRTCRARRGCRCWRVLPATDWATHWLVMTLTSSNAPHCNLRNDSLNCTRSARKKTRSSAIAEGPRDASCQLKSCQLPRNSAETTYTTSPDQIDGMKLEI